MSTIAQQVPQPAFPELASPEAAHPVSELIDATEVLLNSRKIEVYTGPSPDGYASRVDYAPGEHVAPHRRRCYAWDSRSRRHISLSVPPPSDGRYSTKGSQVMGEIALT